jgi:hypothetical protein
MEFYVFLFKKGTCAASRTYLHRVIHEISLIIVHLDIRYAFYIDDIYLA